jgi:hypothetical protein
MGKVQTRGWKNIIKMSLMDIECERGRWKEPSQDYIQWQSLVPEVLNVWVLLP